MPNNPQHELFFVSRIADDISQSTCFLCHVFLPIRTISTVASLIYSSLIFCRIVSVGNYSPILVSTDTSIKE